jgi:hypothetical protein
LIENHIEHRTDSAGEVQVIQDTLSARFGIQELETQEIWQMQVGTGDLNRHNKVGFEWIME